MTAERQRPFRAVVRRDEGEHVAVLRAVAARQIDPADEERGGQRIRTRRVRGDDACAEGAVRRPAGARIDDVTVATAVGDDELLAGAARAERGVPQRDVAMAPSGHAAARRRRQASLAATAQSEQAAAARGKQRVRRRRTRAARRRAIERVALADGAEVQFDARAAEARPSARIADSRCTASKPTCRARGLDRLGGGHRASRRRKPQHRLSGVVVMSKAPSVSR